MESSLALHMYSTPDSFHILSGMIGEQRRREVKGDVAAAAVARKAILTPKIDGHVWSKTPFVALIDDMHSAWWNNKQLSH